MHLHINQDDGTPIYRQIVNQIKYLISSHVLDAGAELTPIRKLAEQLVINPNTVARAYRELETEGYLEKRGTAGTFVSASASPLAQDTQRKILHKRIDALLADAAHMGVGTRELKKLIDERAIRMSPVKTNTKENKRNSS